MDLQEVGCGCMDWIEVTQNRDRLRELVNEVMNFRIPSNAGNFLTSCKTVSCSRRTLLRAVSNLLVPKNRPAGLLSVECTGRSAVHNLAINVTMLVYLIEKSTYQAIFFDSTVHKTL
jgi:hypothetical protein